MGRAYRLLQNICWGGDDDHREALFKEALNGHHGSNKWTFFKHLTFCDDGGFGKPNNDERLFSGLKCFDVFVLLFFLCFNLWHIFQKLVEALSHYTATDAHAGFRQLSFEYPNGFGTIDSSSGFWRLKLYVSMFEVVRVAWSLAFIFYVTLLHCRPSRMGRNFEGWHRVTNSCRQMRFLASFSAMKTLKHLNPRIFIRNLRLELQRREHCDEIVLTIIWFLIRSLGFGIPGLVAFIIKIVDVVAHFNYTLVGRSHSTSETHALIQLMLSFTGFIIQIFGMIDLSELEMKRVWLFIFGGDDASMQAFEWQKKEVFMAAVAHHICSDLYGDERPYIRKFKRLIAILGFSHVDVQKLVLQENVGQETAICAYQLQDSPLFDRAAETSQQLQQEVRSNGDLERTASMARFAKAGARGFLDTWFERNADTCGIIFEASLTRRGLFFCHLKLLEDGGLGFKAMNQKQRHRVENILFSPMKTIQAFITFFLVLTNSYTIVYTWQRLLYFITKTLPQPVFSFLIVGLVVSTFEIKVFMVKVAYVSHVALRALTFPPDMQYRTSHRIYVVCCEIVQDLTNFSAMRFLSHFNIQTLIPSFSAQLADAPCSNLCAACIYCVILRLVFGLVGVVAFIGKLVLIVIDIQIYGPTLLQARIWSIAHQFVYAIGFVNQLFGVTQVANVQRSRVFRFCFGGADAVISESELHKQDAFLAALAYRVMSLFNYEYYPWKRKFKRAVALTTFTHVDLQRLIIDQDHSKEVRLTTLLQGGVPWWGNGSEIELHTFSPTPSETSALQQSVEGMLGGPISRVTAHPTYHGKITECFDHLFVPEPNEGVKDIFFKSLVRRDGNALMFRHIHLREDGGLNRIKENQEMLFTHQKVATVVLKMFSVLGNGAWILYSWCVSLRNVNSTYSLLKYIQVGPRALPVLIVFRHAQLVITSVEMMVWGFLAFYAAFVVLRFNRCYNTLELRRYHVWHRLFLVSCDIIPDLGFLSGMRTMEYLNPQILSPLIELRLAETRQARAERSCRDRISIAWFVCSRIILGLLGFSVFILKFAQVVLTLWQQYSDPSFQFDRYIILQQVVVVAAFINQMLGVTNIDEVERTRVFLLMFGGNDGMMQQIELEKQDTFLACIAYHICEELYAHEESWTRKCKRAVALISFTHNDLQKFVIWEDAKLEEEELSCEAESDLEND